MDPGSDLLSNSRFGVYDHDPCDDAVNQYPSSHSSAPGIALYDFDGRNQSDGLEEREGFLSFPKGARITNILPMFSFIYSHGRYQGRNGLFPKDAIEYQPSTCDHCCQLIPNLVSLEQLVAEGGIERRLNGADFYSSLTQGCCLCNTLYDTFGPSLYDLEASGEAKEIRLQYSAKVLPDSNPYDVYDLVIRNLDDYYNSLQYHIFADDSDPASKVVSSRPTGPFRLDKLELAERWISDCINHHENCPGPELPILPKRVIKLPEMEHGDPKLHLSGGQRGHYVALSYCWGGPQKCTLTRKTIDKKLERISRAELPPGIIDALDVAWRLGLRYLWVDSMCIIQDDDQDKAVEITAMDEIYQNAYITIYAASTPRCDESFLSEWNPRSWPNSLHFSKIRYPLDDSSFGNVFVELISHPYSPNDEHLSRRGWTLQERLLSPRVLNFGRSEMYWQCQSSLHGETGPCLWFGRDGADRLSNEFFLQKVKTNMPQTFEHLYDNWADVVEGYSQRQLSISTDYLPAISGIAKRFAMALSDTYCAGLWKNSLQFGLGWTRKHGSKRSSGYRAPTWSWACLDARVTWPYAHYDPTCTDRTRRIGAWGKGQTALDIVARTHIISCDIQPVYPAAPFGEIKDGTITLRGCVADFDWDGGERLIKLEDSDSPYPKILPDLDEEVLPLGGTIDQQPGSVNFHMTRDTADRNTTTRQISCVPLTDNTSLALRYHPDERYYTRVAIVQHAHDRLAVLVVPQLAARRRETVDKLYRASVERTIVIK